MTRTNALTLLAGFALAVGLTLGYAGSSAQSRPVSTQQWEYRLVETPAMESDQLPDVQRRLSQYGREGWELVQHREDVAIFRRARR